MTLEASHYPLTGGMMHVSDGGTTFGLGWVGCQSSDVSWIAEINW